MPDVGTTSHQKIATAFLILSNPRGHSLELLEIGMSDVRRLTWIFRLQYMNRNQVDLAMARSFQYSIASYSSIRFVVGMDPVFQPNDLYFGVSADETCHSICV